MPSTRTLAQWTCTLLLSLTASNAGAAVVDTVIATAGEAVPLGAPGTVAGGLGFPVINELGEVALIIELNGQIREALAVWTEAEGLSAAAFTGDQAADLSSPDCLADPQILDFGSTVHISDGSWVLALATLTCPTATIPRNPRGLLRVNPSGLLELVAASGDFYNVAGLANATVMSIDEAGGFALASSGHVAFRATVSVGTGQSMVQRDALYLREPNGNLKLIAAIGDAAPGAGAGVTFETIGAPGVSAAGTAFRVRMEGPGVDITNRLAIYRRLHGGALELIARDGDAAGNTGETFASLVNSRIAPGILDSGAGFFSARLANVSGVENLFRFAANGDVTLGIESASEAVGNQSGALGGSPPSRSIMEGDVARLGLSENGFSATTLEPQLVANGDLYFVGFDAATSNGLIVRWTHDGDVEIVAEAQPPMGFSWGNHNAGTLQQGRNANAAGQVAIRRFNVGMNVVTDVIVRVPEPSARALGLTALVLLAAMSRRRTRAWRVVHRLAA